MAQNNYQIINIIFLRNVLNFFYFVHNYNYDFEFFSKSHHHNYQL